MKISKQDLPDFKEMWKPIVEAVKAKVEEWRNLPRTPGFKESLERLKVVYNYERCNR